MTDIWKRAQLRPSATIREAIRNLNDVAIQIVLIVNDNGVLEGTLSDGDIRRGLLRGLDLDSEVDSVVYRTPMVVPPEVSLELVKQLMVTNKIHQVPIVDESRHVLGLHLWDEMIVPVARENIMVIMAGGEGIRLRPYTETCPKPMLTVAGKPMLEHIIERAKAEGFSNFILAVHYLGHMIEEYFGSGSKFGVIISYLKEQQPLGTAGALSLISQVPDQAIIVTNGDVISDVRYGELLDFHFRNNATATMAVRLHEWQHPYGVVRMEGINIIGFEEKPISRTHINAGVYALSPEIFRYLSPNIACDMPALFAQLQEKNCRTVAYPMHEPWLDVGRPDDLKLANTTAINTQINK